MQNLSFYKMSYDEVHDPSELPWFHLFTVITKIYFPSQDISYLHRNSNNEYLGKIFDTISYLIFHVMSQGNCKDVRVSFTTQSGDLQEVHRAAESNDNVEHVSFNFIQSRNLLYLVYLLLSLSSHLDFLKGLF